KIGKTIRVCSTVFFNNQGNYTRICVEVGLHKLLLSKYRLRRRVRKIKHGVYMIFFSIVGDMAMKNIHSLFFFSDSTYSN
ncbi:hypothetical protein LINPERPRIM_LOCUS36495, partial [Linum perenne]